MFDDMPKSSPWRKIFYTFLVLAFFGASGYYFYQTYLFEPQNVSPSSNKITGRILGTSSPTPNYQLPSGEILISSSNAETNGDAKNETLVASRQIDNKYHLYVLSAESKVLFELKNLTALPINITSAIYQTGERYISWKITTNENTDNVFFIHYSGSAYEVPQDPVL